MAEEPKEYKVKCPECHKTVTKRGLSAHMRMAHPEGSTDQPRANKVEGVPCPTDTESSEAPAEQAEPEQQPSAELDAEKVKAVYGPLMEKIAQDTFQKGMSMMLEQLPGLIDTRIQSMVEQAAAQAQVRTTGLPTTSGHLEQPNPAAVVEGQPAAGAGKMEQLMGLMQMAQQLGLVPNPQQQQQNPMDMFVKQLEGLGKVIGAVDTIRGGGSGMSPNAALGWMKFGHQLGASGAPPPDFPPVTEHPPPSPEMGKQEGGQ